MTLKDRTLGPLRSHSSTPRAISQDRWQEGHDLAKRAFGVRSGQPSARGLRQVGDGFRSRERLRQGPARRRDCDPAERPEQSSCDSLGTTNRPLGVTIPEAAWKASNLPPAFGKDHAFRERILCLARLESGESILDVGWDRNSCDRGRRPLVPGSTGANLFQRPCAIEPGQQ
jgi:hypothetical protein